MADTRTLRKILDQVLDILAGQRGKFTDGLIVLGTLTPKDEMRAEAWSGAELYVSEQRPAEDEDE